MSITLNGTTGIIADSPATVKANAFLDAAGGNTATINGKLPIAIGDVPAANVQTFTASGTWTKPAGASVVYVRLVGGGGGGSSGWVAASASFASGGHGGGGGGSAITTLNASTLPATVTVTVGAGGVGAVPTTTGTANGGSNGGNSTFGIYFTRANLGVGAPFNSPGSGGGIVPDLGGTGGSGGSPSTVGDVSASIYAGAGGGGGGCVLPANTVGASSVGGANTPRGTSGGTAGAAGSVGGIGGSGSGGGGGGGALTGNGGTGGAGALGGGGGGGGGARTGNSTGSGGAGGAGYVEVYSW